MQDETPINPPPQTASDRRRYGKYGGIKQGRQPGKRGWTPTLKMAKYATNMAEGMPQAQAAHEAGYSTDAQQLYKLRHNPNLQEWIRNGMEDAGIDVTTVCKVLAAGMKATKVDRRYFEGKKVGEHKDIDHGTRIAAAKAAAELAGMYPKRGGDNAPANPGNTTNILMIVQQIGNISDEDLEASLANDLLNGQMLTAPGDIVLRR